MAHDVFISHSARDKPYADAMCAKLESRGIRCWIAPRDIRPGSWGDTTGSLRSADRNSVLTSYRSGDLGFRVARTL